MRTGAKILGLFVLTLLSRAVVVQAAPAQPTLQTPKAAMETLIRAAGTLDARLWAQCLSSSDRPEIETMISGSGLRHLEAQKKRYEAGLGRAIGEETWEFAALITVVDVTGGQGLPGTVLAMTHIKEEAIWDDRYAEVTVIIPLNVRGYLPPLRFHFVKENGEWKFCQWLTTRLMLGWDRSQAGNPDATINLLLKAHGVEIDRGECANLRRTVFRLPETASSAYRSAIEKARPSDRGQLVLLWAAAGGEEAERRLAEEDARNPQAGLLKTWDQHLKLAAALKPCTPPPAEVAAKVPSPDSPEFWLRTFDQDIPGLRMLLARFPEEKSWCLKARLGIASIHLRREAYQQAADEYAQAAALYPEPSDDLVEAKQHLARLFWNNLDRKQEAIRLWRELEAIGRLPPDAVLGESPLEITTLLRDSATGWMTGIMDFDLSPDGGLVLLRLESHPTEEGGGTGSTVSRLDLHDATGVFQKTLAREEAVAVSGATREIFMNLQRAGNSYYVRVNGGNGKILVFDTSGTFRGQLRRQGLRFLKEGARSFANSRDDARERQELMPRAFSVGGDSFGILTMEMVRFFDMDGNLLREVAIPHGQYGSNTLPVMTGTRAGDVVFTQPSPGKVFRLDRAGSLTPMRHPGTVEGEFTQISHLFTDVNRNIYVVDPPSRKVLKFDRAGTFVRSFSHESVTQPTSATVDDAGTIYLVGYGFGGGSTVTTIDSEGRYLDAVLLPTRQVQAPNGNILDVEVSRGDIYATVGANVIRCDSKGAMLSMYKSADRNSSIGALIKDDKGQIHFTADGKFFRYAGAESQPLALPPDESKPRGMGLRQGGFLVAGFDRSGAMIGVAANGDPTRLETRATSFQRFAGDPGRGVFGHSMAADADGRLLYVGLADHAVHAVAPDGTEAVVLRPSRNARQFWHPQDVALDGQDNIYVYDGANKSILKFKPDGAFAGESSLRTQVPGRVQRIRIDEEDRLYLLVDDPAKESRHIARLTLQALFEGGRPAAAASAAGVGEARCANESYRLATSTVIPYGKEIDRLGMASGPEIPRQGPESFSVDEEGNTYVCDTQNRRIQIFSRNGTYLNTISLTERGTWPSDVIVDGARSVYVYDKTRSELYQYDERGKLLAMVAVNPNRTSAQREMRIVNGRILMGGILIAKIVDGLLTRPTVEELAALDPGTIAASGRIYSLSLERFEGGIISVLNDDKPSLYFPLGGIVSISFLGEDREGNFYVETERTDDAGADETTPGRVILEVHKFSPDMKRLASLLIPENDYSASILKLLQIDKNGNVYQLLPATDAAKLNIFLIECAR